MSLLHQAVAKGNQEDVRRYLEVYYIDEREPGTAFTPLMVAVSSGRVGVIECLLNHETRPALEARDRDGRTPLIHAARFEHVSFTGLREGRLPRSVIGRRREEWMTRSDRGEGGMKRGGDLRWVGWRA